MLAPGKKIFCGPASLHALIFDIGNRGRQKKPTPVEPFTIHQQWLLPGTLNI